MLQTDSPMQEKRARDGHPTQAWQRARRAGHTHGVLFAVVSLPASSCGHCQETPPLPSCRLPPAHAPRLPLPALPRSILTAPAHRLLVPAPPLPRLRLRISASLAASTSLPCFDGATAPAPCTALSFTPARLVLPKIREGSGRPRSVISGPAPPPYPPPSPSCLPSFVLPAPAPARVLRHGPALLQPRLRAALRPRHQHGG